MSADNGIYILATTDVIKVGEEEKPMKIVAYRVAHGQAVECNLTYAKETEPYNIGWWLGHYFNKSEVYYDRNEAWNAAKQLHDEYEWTEYGIVELDYIEYDMDWSVDPSAKE